VDLRCAGLEPIGNTAGNPARFIVETFSAGRGDLTVTVLNPRGVQEPVSKRVDKATELNLNEMKAASRGFQFFFILFYFSSFHFCRFEHTVTCLCTAVAAQLSLQ